MMLQRSGFTRRLLGLLSCGLGLASTTGATTGYSHMPVHTQLQFLVSPQFKVLGEDVTLSSAFSGGGRITSMRMGWGPLPGAPPGLVSGVQVSFYNLANMDLGSGAPLGANLA